MSNVTSGIGLVLVLLVSPLSAAEPQWVTPAEHVDQFGQAVALHEDLMAVGAPGAAYVFRYRDGAWHEEAQLVISGGAASRFGETLALEKDLLVVGAPRERVDDAEEAGSVHVFQYRGGEWVHKTRLLPRYVVAEARFGSSVAISGRRIAVGAPEAVRKPGHPRGLVYVFDPERDELAKWQETARLEVTDEIEGMRFGHAVAIHGDTLAVGRSSEEDKGSIYIYELRDSAWMKVARLEPGFRVQDGVGRSVAIEGDVIIAGGTSDALPGVLWPIQGLVHILERSESGWRKTRSLEATWPEPLGQFGSFVAMADGLMAAADAYDPGYEITVFKKAKDWKRVVKLSDDRHSSRLGKGLAVSKRHLVLGNPELATADGTGAQGVVLAYDMAQLLDEQAVAPSSPPVIPEGVDATDPDETGGSHSSDPQERGVNTPDRHVETPDRDVESPDRDVQAPARGVNVPSGREGALEYERGGGGGSLSPILALLMFSLAVAGAFRRNA